MNSTNAAIRQFLINAQNDPDFMMYQIEDSVSFGFHIEALLSRLEGDQNVSAAVFPNPNMWAEVLADFMQQHPSDRIIASINPTYVLGASHVLSMLLFDHYPEETEDDGQRLIEGMNKLIIKIVRDAYTRHFDEDDQGYWMAAQMFSAGESSNDAG